MNYLLSDNWVPKPITKSSFGSVPPPGLEHCCIQACKNEESSALNKKHASPVVGLLEYYGRSLPVLDCKFQTWA